MEDDYVFISESTGTLPSGAYRHIYACRLDCCADISIADPADCHPVFDLPSLDIKGGTVNPPYSGGWKVMDPPFFISHSGGLYTEPKYQNDYPTAYRNEHSPVRISGVWKDVSTYNYGDHTLAINDSGHLYTWGKFALWNDIGFFNEYVETKNYRGILDCSIASIRPNEQPTILKLKYQNFSEKSSTIIKQNDIVVGSGFYATPLYKYFLEDGSTNNVEFIVCDNDNLDFLTVIHSGLNVISPVRFNVNLEYSINSVSIINSGINYNYLDIYFENENQQTTTNILNFYLVNGSIAYVHIASPGSFDHIPNYNLFGDGSEADIEICWNAKVKSINILSEGYYEGMSPVMANNTEFLSPLLDISKIIDIKYKINNTLHQSILYDDNGLGYDNLYVEVTGWNILNSGSGYSSNYYDPLIFSTNIGQYRVDLGPGPVQKIIDLDSPANASSASSLYSNRRQQRVGYTFIGNPAGYPNDPITSGNITYARYNEINNSLILQIEPSGFTQNNLNLDLTFKPNSGKRFLADFSSQSPWIGSGAYYNEGYSMFSLTPTGEIVNLIGLLIVDGQERHNYDIEYGEIHRSIVDIEFDRLTDYDSPKFYAYGPTPSYQSENLILYKRNNVHFDNADFGRPTAKSKTDFIPYGDPEWIPSSHKNIIPNHEIDFFYKLYSGSSLEIDTYTVDTEYYDIEEETTEVSRQIFISGIKAQTNDFVIEPEIIAYNYPILPLLVDQESEWKQIAIVGYVDQPTPESNPITRKTIVGIQNDGTAYHLSEYYQTPVSGYTSYPTIKPLYSGDVTVCTNIVTDFFRDSWMRVSDVRSAGPSKDVPLETTVGWDMACAQCKNESTKVTGDTWVNSPYYPYTTSVFLDRYFEHVDRLITQDSDNNGELGKNYFSVLPFVLGGIPAFGNGGIYAGYRPVSKLVEDKEIYNFNVDGNSRARNLSTSTYRNFGNIILESTDNKIYVMPPKTLYEYKHKKIDLNNLPECLVHYTSPTNAEGDAVTYSIDHSPNIEHNSLNSWLSAVSDTCYTEGADNTAQLQGKFKPGFWYTPQPCRGWPTTPNMDFPCWDHKTFVRYGVANIGSDSYPEYINVDLTYTPIHTKNEKYYPPVSWIAALPINIDGTIFYDINCEDLKNELSVIPGGSETFIFDNREIDGFAIGHLYYKDLIASSHKYICANVEVYYTYVDFENDRPVLKYHKQIATPSVERDLAWEARNSPFFGGAWNIECNPFSAVGWDIKSPPSQRTSFGISWPIIGNSQACPDCLSDLLDTCAYGWIQGFANVSDYAFQKNIAVLEGTGKLPFTDVSYGFASLYPAQIQLNGYSDKEDKTIFDEIKEIKAIAPVVGGLVHYTNDPYKRSDFAIVSYFRNIGRTLLVASGECELEYYHIGQQFGNVQEYTNDFWLNSSGDLLNRETEFTFTPQIFITNSGDIRSSVSLSRFVIDRYELGRENSGKSSGVIKENSITMFDDSDHSYFAYYKPSNLDIVESYYDNYNYFTNYRIDPTGISVSGYQDLNMPGIPFILVDNNITAHNIDIKYDGKLNHICVEKPGFGFRQSPKVHINGWIDSTGRNGEGIAVIEGPIELKINNPGFGYIAPPIINFIGSGIKPIIAKISLNEVGSITEIKLLSGGLYKNCPPLIELSNELFLNENGVSAEIEAMLDGSVAYIIITDPGHGYQYPPDIVIDTDTNKYSSNLYTDMMAGLLTRKEYEAYPYTAVAQCNITGVIGNSGIPTECITIDQNSLSENIRYFNGDILLYCPGLDTGYPAEYQIFSPKAKEIYDCNSGYLLDTIIDEEIINVSSKTPMKPYVCMKDGGIIVRPNRFKHLKIVGEVGINPPISETGCDSLSIGSYKNPYINNNVSIIDEQKIDLSKYYYRHDGIADVELLYAKEWNSKFMNNKSLDTLPDLSMFSLISGIPLASPVETIGCRHPELTFGYMSGSIINNNSKIYLDQF